MKDLNDLRNSDNLRDFESVLGKKKRRNFFEMISEAIESGRSGDDLKKSIYSVLCKLSVTEIEIFEISNFLVQVITKTSKS